MKNKQHITVATLANAVELGARVVQEIAGNEISDQVAGVTVKETVKDTLTAQIAKRVSVQGSAL